MFLTNFKYHWRRFATWTKETIDAELAALLSGYDTKFKSISCEHLEK
ncbi:hypothetical protein SAMN05444172_9076 [Burkholderia sp. GAS332]|nr:hypothetical protein SAMN05444172_9076 [Burkholderia sp. GAS332]